MPDTIVEVSLNKKTKEVANTGAKDHQYMTTNRRLMSSKITQGIQVNSVLTNCLNGRKLPTEEAHPRIRLANRLKPVQGMHSAGQGTFPF